MRKSLDFVFRFFSECFSSSKGRKFSTSLFRERAVPSGVPDLYHSKTAQECHLHFLNVT